MDERRRRGARDEFSAQVKDALCRRVANRCSNPSCWAITSGPQATSDRAVNVGVAAHITAAASRGPRFDPRLSTAERRAASNGIWLCQTCGKLVNSDLSQFTAEQLRLWKRNAEEAACELLGKPDPSVGSGLALEPGRMKVASGSASLAGECIDLTEKYTFSVRNRFTVPVYDIWVRFRFEGIDPMHVDLDAAPRADALILPDGLRRGDTLALRVRDQEGDGSLLLAICRIGESEVYEFTLSVKAKQDHHGSGTVSPFLLKWSTEAVPVRSGSDTRGELYLFPLTFPLSGTITGMTFFLAECKS